MYYCNSLFLVIKQREKQALWQINFVQLNVHQGWKYKTALVTFILKYCLNLVMQCNG